MVNRIPQYASLATPCLALLAALCCSAGSSAQATVPAATTASDGPTGIVRLDLAVAREEDTSALSTSLRVAPMDLAQPSGFSNLYRVPGRPDLFMRGHGALFGVFEQSAYTRMNGRTVALWPAGTMFFIGVPTPEMLKNFGHPPEAKSAPAPSADSPDGAVLVVPLRVQPALAHDEDTAPPSAAATKPPAHQRCPMRAAPLAPDAAPLRALDRAEAVATTANIEPR